MRRSYADMLKDDDEAMKIISPTYRELGKKKYDEMMEMKDKEIKLQKKELRLKQVEELKEILNNNSKNKEDSDTLIIYSYNLKYKNYMDQIIPCFLKALYKKYGKVHFISYSFNIVNKHVTYKQPHDVIELNENLHNFIWNYEFFENTYDITTHETNVGNFYFRYENKYKYIYEFSFDEDIEYINDDKFINEPLSGFDFDDITEFINEVK